MKTAGANLCVLLERPIVRNSKKALPKKQKFLATNKFILTLVVAVTMSFSAKAQDPTFSQFYLNKTYLNPAYAGYTKDLSAYFQTRYQWTHVPGEFATNTAGFNVGSAHSRMGYGMQFYDNVEGEGRLHTSSAAFQTSINIPGRYDNTFGRKMYGRKYILSVGFQAAVSQKTIDWSKLTFTDQLDPYAGLINQASQLSPSTEVSNIMVDVSTGVRFRTEIDKKGSFISTGAAAFHLNRPTESFLNYEARIDPRYTFHFFTHLQTRKFANDPRYFSVGYVFDKQQVLQTNTVYLARDISKQFTIGVGLRRKLVFNVDKNVDSFIIQSTFNAKGLVIGYSYDLTVSSLQVSNSYGTHEFGIVYIFEGKHLKKRRSGGKSKYRSAEDCFYLNKAAKKSNSRGFVKP